MFANVFLACVAPLSILGLGLSTPSGDNNNNDGNPLESVQLTHAQAKSLCESVTTSQIDNGQLYQWIQVQREQQEETEAKKHGGCFKIGFTPCLGEARAPLKSDCGIFNLFTESEDQCDQSSSSGSRSKRSVSLTHGQAHHLCHTIKTVPESLDEINFVAIKFHPRDPTNETIQISHASELCVTWAYKPCMLANEANCDRWQKIIKPGKKCASFQSENSVPILRSSLQQEISSSSMPEMKQLIRCTSIDSRSGVQCKLLPLGAEISTEDQDSHSRQKRRSGRCIPLCCCGMGYCSCCCGGWTRGVMGRCGVCCPPRVCNG